MQRLVAAYEQGTLQAPAGILLAASPTIPYIPAHSTCHTDRAGRTWLELNPERCSLEIAQANAGGWRLVGYWHTHPQVEPMISPTDVASLVRFAATHSVTLPFPLAVIVGNPNHRLGIRAWSIRDGQAVEGGRIPP
ncbi:Mov34/MPN/PAD-1 family protein [Stenotrophomonas maltophilia]|uniref:Mov34/MPN/PAD-1 family protein n=1 Tax=Stenotrophomonas maltophilia TaxID=40324 RepID=UPI0032023A0F|nr:Mov34/MPN/PAD-1 family protein [Stenotrophomonas maltophilia]